jgi:hypothetical protein
MQLNMRKQQGLQSGEDLNLICKVSNKSGVNRFS